MPFVRASLSLSDSYVLRNDVSYGLHAVLFVKFLSFALNVLHLALPIYSMQVFNRVLTSGNLATLVLLTLLIIFLIACSIVIDGARSTILSRMSSVLDTALHQQAISVLLKGDPSGHDNLRFAERLRALQAGPLLTTLFDTPWSVIFVLVIYLLHPWLGHLTVISIAILTGIGMLGPALSGRNRLDAATASREITQELSNALSQRDAVDAMGLRERTQAAIRGLHGRFVTFGGKACEQQSWNDAVARGLRSMCQVGLLSLAALLVVTDEIPTGTIVAASMLFARALSPIERLGSGAHSIVEVARMWRQIGARSQQGDATRKRLALPRIKGAVTVERAYVTAAGRSRPILGPLSFEVRAGEVLAIVGPQGAGKSTLARMLAGALAPNSGTVRIDGTEAPHFDHEDLGSQVGFLPEDIQLGSGTVATIISRGQDPDPDEVVRAAMLAGAHRVIQRLPNGYETIVQPGHLHLSAGERQQIGLARAFYGRPALIVLDEPTTHLDDNAETDTVRAIKELKREGSTVVVVSRFAGLLHITDRVMLLNEGTVKLLANQDKLASMLGPKLATSSPGEASDDERRPLVASAM